MGPAGVLRATLIALAVLATAPALAARDVLLVLDNSGSMRRNDPQRLALSAVNEFIRGQPSDTRLGVIIFDTEPTLILPLGPAADAAGGAAERALKDRFRYNGRLTQTAAAIERALYELRSEGRRGSSRAIVLMTDGLIDTGNPQKNMELGRWLRQDLAAQAKADGVRIFGIAFTESADYELLQSLAASTGAEYFRVLNPQGIARALDRIDAMMLAEPTPPAPAAAPAAQAPAQVAPAPAPAPKPTPKPEGFPAWIGLALGLVGLLIPVIAWLLWRRYRPVSDATSPDNIKVHRDAGPVGVLFDNFERHELGSRPVVIGRASGSDPERYYIVVPEKTVGRWHATIERRGQTFWLRDEGSVNGTFINNERIVGERPLKHRDQIRFHTHQFEFEIPELGDMDRTLMQPGPRAPLN